MKFTVIVRVAGGESVEVALDRPDARIDTRIDATIDGRTYSLEASAVKPGVWWLNWNQQSIEVTVLPNDGSYSVSIGSHHVPVEIVDPRKYRERSSQHLNKGGGAAEVRASMPGKIVRILKAEGTQVEPHEGIVVMEAMKMQNEIGSGIGGRVIKLAVVEGDTVRSGDLIAIVDPTSFEIR